MNDRRQFLKGILGKLAQAAGAIVVASAAAVAKAQGAKADESKEPAEDLQTRADRLAAGAPPTEESETVATEFLNGGFRNTPLGAFRNAPLGAFRNTPVGNFRNGPAGGFRNTPLGSTWGNGGWMNGPVGGFRNGGWPNGGWRNFW